MKTTASYSLDRDVEEWLINQSEENGRSKSGQLNYILKQLIKKQNGKQSVNTNKP